jgi:hypothetical protein
VSWIGRPWTTPPIVTICPRTGWNPSIRSPPPPHLGPGGAITRPGPFPINTCFPAHPLPPSDTLLQCAGLDSGGDGHPADLSAWSADPRSTRHCVHLIRFYRPLMGQTSRPDLQSDRLTPPRPPSSFLPAVGTNRPGSPPSIRGVSRPFLLIPSRTRGPIGPNPRAADPCPTISSREAVTSTMGLAGPAVICRGQTGNRTVPDPQKG